MADFFGQFGGFLGLSKSPKKVRKSPLVGWDSAPARGLSEEGGQDDQDASWATHLGQDAAESASTTDQPTQGSTTEFPLLEQCVHDASAAKLESHVKTAETVIDNIQCALQKASEAHDASRLLSTIERVKSQNRKVQTVVGVVGDTGSGKSSIINALLDEEMLVPTNCMRACTAVITELSYNDSDDPACRYRAEIEFISDDDWRKELSQLFYDLVDTTGAVVKESSDMETEAGVSWAKIKAVYPQQTKEALGATGVDTLANSPQVQAVLGEKKVVEEAESDKFLEKMQKFIDSTEKEGQRSTGEKKQLEYWPLIKVVRVFVKAEALSTGAVIVDLPGVHDSNAARAAVAEKYIETCNSIWIVAPITRAVDDKTAHKLMSQSFKLQLKFDCKYDYVTFVCSKTDDISVSEAVKSFKDDKEIADCVQELRNTGPKVDESDEKEEALDRERDRILAQRDELQDQIDFWQNRADGVDNGVEAFADSNIPQKRRNPARRARSRKKTRLSHEDDDLDDYDDLYPSEDDTPVKEKSVHIKKESSEEQPFTVQHVQEQLQRLRAEHRNMRNRLTQLDAQCYQAKRVSERHYNKHMMLRIRLRALCIQARNKYSTGAIQHDFARGLKESDQEFAIHEDEELFDPEHDQRDYEAIGASLPVFCVSSRAYQKASGRLRMDEKVGGFRELENTGIPQLQEYAKKVTEGPREDISRRYMKNFTQFVHHLRLWAYENGKGSQLNEGEKRDQVEAFKKDLEGLEKNLKHAASLTVEKCRNILTSHIYDKFGASISAAAEAAVPTVNQWFTTKRNGGLTWNTFKSICVRDGAHTTRAAGFRNLNEELALPQKQYLANTWERAMSSRIPNAIADFPKSSLDVLNKFHQSVKDDIPSEDHDVLFASLLRNVNYGDAFDTFQQHMTTSQQEANRSFTPAIASSMEPVYRVCEAEHGKKMYSRMQGHMLRHIRINRDSMFRTATDKVRTKLDAICNDLHSELDNRIKQSIEEITFDFESGIIGTNRAQASKAARLEVYEILTKIDALFASSENDDAEVKLTEIKEDDDANVKPIMIKEDD